MKANHILKDQLLLPTYKLVFLFICVPFPSPNFLIEYRRVRNKKSIKHESIGGCFFGSYVGQSG
jgi:hypothetical protein